ncbi:hypothetical protein [Anaerolactibacter massiliensis]|uniref:hypothetical protein n=1 Tax=Anaerolactibacter massiliensis TaxID=2044573 RepID=UPI000CF9ECAC|nr:hypothetical protein [Anaerolactibacter massiliensis]
MKNKKRWGFFFIKCLTLLDVTVLNLLKQLVEKCRMDIAVTVVIVVVYILVMAVVTDKALRNIMGNQKRDI